MGKSNDLLLSAVTPKPEPFIRRHGKRLAGGLLCAAIVSLVMHLTPVVEGIRWLGEGIRWTLGRPAILKKPPPIKKPVQVAIDKAKEIASEHKPTIPKVAAPVIRPPIPKAAPIVAATIAAPRVVAAVGKLKDAEDKLARGEERLAAGAHDLADMGRKTSAKIANAIHKRNEEREKAHRDQLIVRARKVKLTVDEAWSLERLDAEVNEAEDIAWRKRYNGQCPRCHYPAHISRNLKYGQLICNRCHTIFSVGTARGLGAPPRPKPGTGWRLPW
jgi:hypothetical protein